MFTLRALVLLLNPPNLPIYHMRVKRGRIEGGYTGGSGLQPLESTIKPPSLSNITPFTWTGEALVVGRVAILVKIKLKSMLNIKCEM